ncbi:MAG: FeoB-associated Cys-rich membrane protein [Tannerella sp.]|nr:FeoB-associated Cys-rich membrane protein [Tannerella sp.]
MWQEIAILIIGILVSARAGWKIYRLFVPSGKRSSCAHCAHDCPVKAQDKCCDRMR